MIENLFKKMVVARSKFVGVQETLEQHLVDKVQFDFFIQHHQSDGFCLVDSNNMDTAPLRICLNIIRAKGTLSEKDFKKITI